MKLDTPGAVLLSFFEHLFIGGYEASKADFGLRAQGSNADGSKHFLDLSRKIRRLFWLYD